MLMQVIGRVLYSQLGLWPVPFWSLMDTCRCEYLLQTVPHLLRHHVCSDSSLLGFHWSYDVQGTRYHRLSWTQISG